MPKFAMFILLSVAINFFVLACLSMLVEYFDTGDDPIYSAREAIKNLIMAVVIAGTTTYFISRRGKND